MCNMGPAMVIKSGCIIIAGSKRCRQKIPRASAVITWTVPSENLIAAAGEKPAAKADRKSSIWLQKRLKLVIPEHVPLYFY